MRRKQAMNKKDIDKTAVGERIKEIRLNKGYTLEAFGKLFGVSKSNVLKWEQGKALPNKERIKDICKIADITREELLYGNSDKVIESMVEQYFKLSLDDRIKFFELLKEKREQGEQGE